MDLCFKGTFNQPALSNSAVVDPSSPPPFELVVSDSGPEVNRLYFEIVRVRRVPQKNCRKSNLKLQAKVTYDSHDLMIGVSNKQTISVGSIKSYVPTNDPNVMNKRCIVASSVRYRGSLRATLQVNRWWMIVVGLPLQSRDRQNTSYTKQSTYGDRRGEAVVYKIYQPRATSM